METISRQKSFEQNDYSDFVENVKKNNDIVDVISEQVPVYKKGSNEVCLCPFHQDTNPSLHISRQKQLFKCFACGKEGDVINFIQYYKGISCFEAILELENKTNDCMKGKSHE